MKTLLTILLLLSIKTFAQTQVKARDYIKIYNGYDKDETVVVKAGGYCDYVIAPTKAGIYTFNVQVLNGDGIPTSIKIKTPTGRTILANVSIPLAPTYQAICAKVKLGMTTKKIRLVFDDDVTVSGFSYGIDGPVEYVTKSYFDSVINSIKKTIWFDENYFDGTGDSTDKIRPKGADTTATSFSSGVKTREQFLKDFPYDRGFAAAWQTREDFIKNFPYDLNWRKNLMPDFKDLRIAQVVIKEPEILTILKQIGTLYDSLNPMRSPTTDTLR